MLRLNVGSGMLRFTSRMLSIGRGPKAVQGKGGGGPPLPCSHLGTNPMLRMHELSLPEPMLSLSMLILATCPEHAQECSEHCSARSARSWPLGTRFEANTVGSCEVSRHACNDTCPNQDLVAEALIYISGAVGLPVSEGGSAALLPSTATPNHV